MKYRITWEVDDGYAGGSRPQNMTFDSTDYADDEEWSDMTENEKSDIIDQAIVEDFNNKVHFSIISREEVK